MSLYHEMQYHDMTGSYELIGAFLGLVAGLYFSQEISSFIKDSVIFAGLVTFITKEPAITKIVCGAGGLFGGYFLGKFLGNIATYFRRQTDNKKIREESDDKIEWVKQISKRGTRPGSN